MNGYDADVAKIIANGYPEEMRTFYIGKINGVRGSLQDLVAMYTTEVMKPDKVPTEEAKSTTTALEAALKSCETLIADFIKTTGSNMRRLAA